MNDLMSRVYSPDPKKCCEACAFGRGEHAEFCEKKAPTNKPRHPFLGDFLKMANYFATAPVRPVTHPPCMACLYGNANHAEWCVGQLINEESR